MTGYARLDMGGWHLRVVYDQGAALRHLMAHWSHLPSSFFGWLGSDSDATYRLVGFTFEPELWVKRPAITDTTTVEQREEVPA